MLKTDVEKGKDIVEGVTEKILLRLFRAGCDKTNYKILNSLPLKTRALEKKFKLSVMPMNRRLNQLINAKLVKRNKKTFNVEKTELADKFLEVLADMKKKVIKELSKLI